MAYSGTALLFFYLHIAWESRKERDHSEDRDVDGSMGSEWILGRLDGGGMGSAGSG
jgi:hypothetical protein